MAKKPSRYINGTQYPSDDFFKITNPFEGGVKATVNIPPALQKKASSAPTANSPVSTDVKSPDLGSIASTALGVSSLIKGLRNKKPKPLKPTAFKGNIRPAQGNEEALQRTKNDISEQVSSASKDVTRIAGSDANAGIAARLGIQDNATKAIANAEAENAKLYQADQNRVSQELNQAEMINSQMKTEADQYNSLVEQQNYAANQTASAQGVQSALQYGIDRRSNQENNRIIQDSGNQTIDAMEEGQWNETYRLAYEKNGGNSAKAKLEADSVMKHRNFSKFKSNTAPVRPWWQGMFGKRKNAPVRTQQ